MSFKQLLAEYFWPACCGLLFALLILLILSPDWNRSEPDTTPLNSLSEPGEWVGPASYSLAVQQAAPSVVNIYTTKKVVRAANPLLNDPFFQRFFNRLQTQETQEQLSLGSGVIISPSGFIVTNKHVIDGADVILVLLQDGRQARAEVSGVDAETDLAVLRIDTPNLKSIRIGDPNSARVGDVMLAIGNPFGVGQTVTQGILSAMGRNLDDTNFYVPFLQTDAAINDGNSGGALVDVNGHLIGINSRKLDSNGSVGLGFAIPADVALKVVKDIVERGEVVRGWVGIEALPISDRQAESLNLRPGHGMMVTALYTGGPAHRAGLEVGDLITKINDRAITDGRRVPSMIAEAEPGSKMTFDIVRSGTVLRVVAVVDERPKRT